MSGRKPSKPEDKYSITKLVKMTPEQEQRLKELAEQTGRTQSEILRSGIEKPGGESKQS